MSRRAQLILLCEDQQHEVFLRRFLERIGWDKRKFRVERSPPGKGSAELFVRRSFPQELKTYRVRRNHVECMLVIMIDGDAGGVDARMAALDEACRNADVQPRQREDRVAVLVPTWRIETWLAYLDGEDVDECRKDYRRLNRPNDCRTHVGQLASMCRERRLRPPAPLSLEAACEEYRTRIAAA